MSTSENISKNMELLETRWQNQQVSGFQQLIKPDKTYVCELRKRPTIKQETHEIMGVTRCTSPLYLDPYFQNFVLDKKNIRMPHSPSMQVLN